MLRIGEAIACLKSEIQMAEPDFIIVSLGSIDKAPKPSGAQITASQGLISGLNFAKIWKSGGISSSTPVRLDGQASAGGGGANLQIQINGVKRTATQGTTIAGVLVDGGLRDFGKDTDKKYQDKIVARTKEALKQSLASGRNYQVKKK